MRVALVNPAWSYEGSIYFGCREAHLPLEHGYSAARLAADGHEPRIFDGQIEGQDNAALAERVAAFAPAMTVVTTAPTYLFWRCAPPELRVPQETMRALDGIAGLRIVVGPHASSTPVATLRKLDVHAAVLGECEDILPRLAADEREWGAIDSLARRDDGGVRVQGLVEEGSG